jgi:hypothetical protein
MCENKIKKILDERTAEYGDANNAFTVIGCIWGALLNRDAIKPHQVALMMDALKTVRVFNNPAHEDSWNDKIGYVKLALDIVNKNDAV